MGFEDIAAKLKARKQQQADSVEATPYDFNESYRIRAKMLGVLLRDARTSAARTIDDCARLLKVSPSTIEEWEFGDSVPSLPQLELLAYYLDVPISHFWGLETSKVSREGKETIQPEYITLRNHMIGALMRHAREEAGVSIEDLSQASGLPIELLQQYEMGEAAPPMHELAVLAGGVKKNIDFFLEANSQIGELLRIREAWKRFSELPEEVRTFASDPVNVGFLQIAVMFSQMPADRLRQVGASILDITM